MWHLWSRGSASTICSGGRWAPLSRGMSGMLGLVLRSLAARRLRAALTILAVALGVAVMLGVQIGVAGLMSQAQTATRLRAGNSALDVRATVNGGLSGAQLTQISTVSGVAEVVPLYEKRVVARPAKLAPGGLPVQVSLVGLHKGAIALRPLAVASGRLPADNSRTEIAVDTRLRDSLGSNGRSLALGDSVVLATVAGDDAFTVVGITNQPTISETFTKDAVVVSDTTLRRVFSLGLRTPLAAVRVSGTSSTDVAVEVNHRLGRTVTTFDPTVTARQPLAQLGPLLLLITALSVLIGAGVSANSVSLSTLERRRDIGLMRAAGASAAQVFRVFVAEAATFAIAGVVLGVGAGVGVGWVLLRIFAGSELPPPTLSIDVRIVAAVAALGIATAVCGAAIPALAASRLAILDALRPESGRPERAPRWLLVACPPLLVVALLTAPLSGGWVVISGFFLLSGIGLALPLILPAVTHVLAILSRPVWPRSRLAAANLNRRRNRTGTAVAGLVVAIAASSATSVLIAGSLSASDTWVRHLFVGDTLVRSPVTQSDAISVALAADSGGINVTPLRFFPAVVNGDVIGMTALDADTYEQNGGLDVISGDRHTVFHDLASGPRLLVPESIASATGWTTGTQLSLTTSSNTTTPRSTTFTVSGVVAHSFPGGDSRESLIVASSQARSYFGDTATGFDDLQVLSPGSFERVRGVASRYGVSAVPVSEVATAGRDAVSRAIGLLLGIAVVTIAIGLLAVVNTLAVTIRQSTRELGLLRAVGLSRAQGLRLLLGEAGLMAVAAAVIGLLSGAALALPMLHASSSPGFTPGFVVAPAVLLAILGAVVVASISAALLPARRATGASIVAAVQHE